MGAEGAAAGAGASYEFSAGGEAGFAGVEAGFGGATTTTTTTTTTTSTYGFGAGGAEFSAEGAGAEFVVGVEGAGAEFSAGAEGAGFKFGGEGAGAAEGGEFAFGAGAEASASFGGMSTTLESQMGETEVLPTIANSTVSPVQYEKPYIGPTA
jgi:hypothetical protein